MNYRLYHLWSEYYHATWKINLFLPSAPFDPAEKISIGTYGVGVSRHSGGVSNRPGGVSGLSAARYAPEVSSSHASSSTTSVPLSVTTTGLSGTDGSQIQAACPSAGVPVQARRGTARSNGRRISKRADTLPVNTNKVSAALLL